MPVRLPSLHTNSEFSFQESTIRLDALIAFAQEHGLTSLVLTDHNAMFGVFDFVEKCTRARIKPVIGLDLDVEDFRLILLARNYAGYQHLCALSSRKMQGQTITRAALDATNIFIIDHPVHGYFAQRQQPLALSNYYVPTSAPMANAVNVAETRILHATDLEALAILAAQAEGKPVASLTVSPYQFEYASDDPRTAVQAEILTACHVVFPPPASYLPPFPSGSKLSSMDYLREIVRAQFSAVLGERAANPLYQARIHYELDIIARLNFADYFLIIWDIVRWAKDQEIVVGPGRGSAAGSLVTYVLGITEVDPLPYSLLFERFLNPERVSMPDIDLDIQDTRRYEVVRYLFAKYGATNVAQITTFSTLGAKSALRDVARVLNVPARDVNTLVKLVPDDLPLREAHQKSARFRAAVSASPLYERLFRLAATLEGLPRQTGTHAAGVVISRTPLEANFPVAIGAEGLNQVQLSMQHLERHGLLKIDLLGLKSLTILKSIQTEVWKSHSRKINISQIPLRDELTNHLLSEGDTNGVFQLESSGMKATLVKVQVDSFNDVVAIISLYRPGPMENIDLYAARKSGREPVPHLLPVVDEITAETYGIIVYQEQIMRIAERFAGMSFAQADILRRAIGKKNAAQIESMRQTFLAGAAAKGHLAQTAREIFALIEKFADYGFNKSHAVAYGMLAYRMAFVKARFKLEFYTALIEVSLGAQDAVRRYVTEARANQITVIPPRLNLAAGVVINNKQRQIILPLNIIKGIGRVAEAKVLSERAAGPFSDFFTAVARLKRADLGDETIRVLVEANVLQEFGNVQTLLDALPTALRYANLITITRDGVKSLDFTLLPRPALVPAPRNLIQEMEFDERYFGFLLNAFPTEGHELAVKLATLKHEVAQEVVVYFRGARLFKDKNSQDYALATVLDSTGEIGLTIFAADWQAVAATPPGTIVQASIMMRDYNGRISYVLRRPWKVVAHVAATD